MNQITDRGGFVMGLLDSLFGGGESGEEVEKKIYNSEASAFFSQYFCAAFNSGGAYFQWLIANSKERMIKIQFFKEGVHLTLLEVNILRKKQTGTYDVDTAGVVFGESGYADLPNGQYVSAFRSFLISEIENNCPVTFVDGQYIKLNESAKKGW